MVLTEVKLEDTTSWKDASGGPFEKSLDRPVRTFSRVGDTQRALYIQRAINKGEKPSVVTM